MNGFCSEGKDRPDRNMLHVDNHIRVTWLKYSLSNAPSGYGRGGIGSHPDGRVIVQVSKSTSQTSFGNRSCFDFDAKNDAGTPVVTQQMQFFFYKKLI